MLNYLDQPRRAMSAGILSVCCCTTITLLVAVAPFL